MAEVLPIRGQRAAHSSPDPPDPPDYITEATVALIWAPIVDEWVIGPDGLPLLIAACEQWDTYQSARAVLAEEGPTTTNPDSGVVRQHPAATVARDALREFRQLFRQLNLQPPMEA